MPKEVTEQTLKFGFQYWFAKLVDIGKQIEPDKYNQDYINYMRGRYINVGISQLHVMVLKRQAQINTL